MAILVGMDEAGYGPNYGPLVVAASAWEVTDAGSGCRVRGAGVDDVDRRTSSSAAVLARPRQRAATDEVDLYRLLRALVSRSPSERRLAIADSKQLYKPGLGLRQLERGVHTVLWTLGKTHKCWSSLVEGCAADPHGHHQKL